MAFQSLPLSGGGNTSGSGGGFTPLPIATQGDVSNIMGQYGVNPSNTIAGQVPMPKLALSANSYAVNPAASAKKALAGIKSNAWAQQQPSWWQSALNGIAGAGETALNWLGRPESVIMNPIYHLTQGDNLANSLASSWKGLTGQEEDNFGQVLDNLGWKPSDNGNLFQNPLGFLNNAAHAITGFAGDVAADPLTYLSFGAEDVAKVFGKIAKPFLDMADTEAKANNIKKGTHAYQTLKDKYTWQNPDFMDVYKQATADNNKKLINYNIPFAPSTGLSIPKPASMTKQTMQVSPELAQGLAQKMGTHLYNTAGIGGDAAKKIRTDLMSHVLGRPVQSTKDLNTQEFDFLNNMWNNHLNDAVTTHFTPVKNVDPFGKIPEPKTESQWRDLLNTHYENFTGTPLPDIKDYNLQDLKDVGQYVLKGLNDGKDMHTAEYGDAVGKATQGVKDAFNATGQTYKHYEGATGFSPLAQKLIIGKDGNPTKLGQAQSLFGKGFGSKRFVSLASQMKNHLLQNGVGHVLHGRNMAMAYSRELIKDLEGIKNTKEFKMLTPEEHKEVFYTMENKRPTHAGYVPPTADRQELINHVADRLREFDQKVKSIEDATGLKYDRIADYAPHYYNKSGESIPWKEIQADLVNKGEKGQQSMVRILNSPGSYQKSRKAFDSMASLTDYIEKGGKYAHEFANTTWNPLEAWGKRAISGMHDVGREMAIKNLKKEGLASRKTAPGWKAVDGIESLQHHVVPDEVYQLLSKGHQLLTNDEALNTFMEHADKINAMLRRNMTATKMGFHTRQLAGHIFHNLLAGITPSSMSKGLKYMTSVGKNPKAYEELTRELLQQGVLHTGESAADLVHSLSHDLQAGTRTQRLGNRLNPVGENFALAHYGRKAGEFMDNVSRVAHYIHMRERGMSPDQAAASVRKFLYQYNEINQAGRYWRMVFPFYQWMRNNLPLQLAMAVKNPKSYQTVQDFLREFQGNTDNQQLMQSMGIGGMINQNIVNQLIKENSGVLPKYIQDNYIKLGKDKNGQDLYYNLALPSQDLKRMAESPVGFFEESMNPILLAMTELHNNESNLTGAPIDKTQPTGTQVYNTPAGMDYLAQSIFGTPAQLLSGAVNGLRTGDYSDAVKGVGLNTASVDPKKALDSLLLDEQNKLSTRAKAIKSDLTKQVMRKAGN